MPLIEKIKSVLFEPSKFFENLKKEKGIMESLDYLAVLLAFSTVMGVIVNYFLQPKINAWLYSLLGIPLLPPTMTFWNIFVFPLLGYFLALAFSFVGAGLLHVWILIFGGKADYEKTYQLSVYSRTPSLVFGWIPFVGFFASLYGLALLIIGTQKVHGIGRTRAILMYVIPLSIIFLLIAVIAIAALYSMGVWLPHAN